MALTVTERTRAYRERVRNGYTPKKQRETRLSKKGYSLSQYGITEDDYNLMVEMQNGKCAICGIIPSTLVVDHDHHTGKVRKLLCNRCNTGIGYFYDNPDIMRKASNYVLDCSIDNQIEELLGKKF